jgi:hypothetical protein
MTVDNSGNYIVAALGRLVKITPAGVGSNIAFTPPGGQFVSVAMDGAGNYIVGDDQLHRILRITQDGTITVVANYPTTQPQNEGLVVAVDGSGNYIIAEDNGAPTLNMFKMTPAGIVTQIPLSGTALPAYSGVGGITFDVHGNYVVTDQENGPIYKITPAGVLSVLASGGVLSRPGPIVRDPSSGNFIVADFGAARLLSIGPSGTPIETLVFENGLTYPYGLGLIASSTSTTGASAVSGSIQTPGLPREEHR